MEKYFYVSVTETLNRIVKVKANSYDEAVDIIEEACARNDLDLDYRDFVDRTEEDVTVEVESLIEEGYVKETNYEEVK